jgi:hypothetical protein
MKLVPLRKRGGYLPCVCTTKEHASSYIAPLKMADGNADGDGESSIIM